MDVILNKIDSCKTQLNTPYYKYDAASVYIEVRDFTPAASTVKQLKASA